MKKVFKFAVFASVVAAGAYAFSKFVEILANQNEELNDMIANPNSASEPIEDDENDYEECDCGCAECEDESL